LGQIKKNSWNRADLSVIYTESPGSNTENAKYEIAVEGFIENNLPAKTTEWPGLKTAYLDGVGVINYASGNGKGLASIIANRASDPWLINELASAKTVTVIDTESELAPELRLILENNGAEVILTSD
jgi:hypothetical protein